jgi:hypothetical protein
MNYVNAVLMSVSRIPVYLSIHFLNAATLSPFMTNGIKQGIKPEILNHTTCPEDIHYLIAVYPSDW